MPALRQQKRYLMFQINAITYAISLDVVEGIAPLPEVIAIPGNRSRVFVGIAYLLGQLISLIDLSPLVNAAPSEHAGQALILKKDKDYYGIKVDAVGALTANPRVKRSREGGLFGSHLSHRGTEVAIIDLDTLIREHVCN